MNADALALVPTGYTTVDEDLRPALDRIAVLLFEKEPTKRGAWRSQAIAEHLRRLIAHARNAEQLLTYGPGFDVMLDEELAHMAARGLMALTLKRADS